MPTYSIRVHPDRVRTIPDPSFPDMKTVFAVVNVQDLPYTEVDGKKKLELSLLPDPRVPKPSKLTSKITKSLKRWDGAFHLLNRGITISAQAADYDNQSKLLTLVLPDDERYGILDGGHTSHSIVTALQDDSRGEGSRDQFVRLEILIGAEELLGDIAGARNTSLAVKPFSLRNKAGEFDWLKQAVAPLDKKIRWSENDSEEYPVLELIQILASCNSIQFPADNQPIEAYKNAGKCLEYLLEPGDPYGYRRMQGVAKDIWHLYDTIRLKWWDMYNKPHPVTGKTGRAGSLAEVRDRKRGKASLMQFPTLNMKGNLAKQKHVEKGLAIPALAGFRALLKPGADGNLAWTCDPFEFFDKHGTLLVRTIMDASDSRDNNPHVVGRDPTVYDLIYRTIESELTKIENEQLKEQLRQHEAARA